MGARPRLAPVQLAERCKHLGFGEQVVNIPRAAAAYRHPLMKRTCNGRSRVMSTKLGSQQRATHHDNVELD